MKNTQVTRPMMNANKVVTIVALALIALADITHASTIKVATKPTPPFAMESEEGEWGGFTFDIFRRIVGTETDLEIQVYSNNDEIFAAVNNGTADVGLAAPTKTKEREEVVDFTYGYYNSGFRIMVKANAGESAVSIFFNSFFNSGFMFSLLLLGLFVVTIATLAWMSEAWFARSRSPSHEPFFKEDWKKGILEGVQWVMLNLFKKETNNPTYWSSRILSVIVMVAGMVFFASFTGYIGAQMVNAQQSSSTINSLSDVRGERVGTVQGTTSHDYLVLEGGLVVVTYETIEEMFDGFHNGDTFAVVYDFPILLYHVKQREEQGLFDTTVVGEVFDKQTYGMVVNESTLKEQLNQGILDIMHTNEYYELMDSYFEITTQPQTEVEISVGWWVGMIILGGLLMTGIYFAVQKVSKKIKPEEDFGADIEKCIKTKRNLSTNSDLFELTATLLGQVDILAERMREMDTKHLTFASASMTQKEYADATKKRRDTIRALVSEAPPNQQN